MLMEEVDHFIRLLQGYGEHTVPTDDSFNPYTDTDEWRDAPNAPSIRTEAMRRTLSVACETGVDALWVGRDFGYRGGRRTGLAFTDDPHWSVHHETWDLSPVPPLPIVSEPIREVSSAVVWHARMKLDARILFWNTLMRHPHIPDEPYTNRCFRGSEAGYGRAVLQALVALVRPRRIIAIGGDAYREAYRIHMYERGQFRSFPVVWQVRHPSYGGIREFRERIGHIYGVEIKPDASLHPLPDTKQSSLDF